jgi:NADH:ubiquinone oxidoreductase subunit 2 (subunit N)
VALVVTTLISGGYYLPVVMAVYMREPLSEDAHAGALLPRPALITVAFAIGLVLVFGVLPAGVLGSALDTAGSLLRDAAGPLVRGP